MFAKILLLWIVGLVTFVPYGTYYLLFRAQRDEYALLITLILFWIFGFWGIAGPILSIIRIRRLFRSLETARTREQLESALRSSDAQETAIDFIATENRIPRFLAKWIYSKLLTKLGIQWHKTS